jgi:hypothetical protein
MVPVGYCSIEAGSSFSVENVAGRGFLLFLHGLARALPERAYFAALYLPRESFKGGIVHGR